MKKSSSAVPPAPSPSAEGQLLGGQPESDQDVREAGLVRLKLARPVSGPQRAEVRQTLAEVPGVDAVRFDPATNEAIVDATGAKAPALVAALRHKGYRVTLG